MTVARSVTSVSESRDDRIRLAILAGAAELGYIGSSEDGEHVLVLPGSERVFHDWVEHPLPEWKLQLTPRGRRWRRLGDRIWHEWEERGSIDLLAHQVERVTPVPDDMTRRDP